MKLGSGDSIAILGDSGSTGCCVAYIKINHDVSRKELGFEDDDWQGKPYAWVSRLQRLYPDVTIRNYSVDGWTARTHLDEGTVDQAASDQPTLALVPLGINDRTNGCSPQEFADDLREIVARIHAGAPQARIVLITEWTYGDEANRSELGEYWEQTSAVAYEQEVELVEWHRQVVIPYPARYLTVHAADFRADDMHPNGADNAVMARLVRQCLDEL